MNDSAVSSWELAARFMSGTSWVLGLACQIAILVVISTVVRRHRPDAWTAMLAWAIAGSIVWLMQPIFGVALYTLFARSEGIAGSIKAHTLQQAVGSVLHLVVIGLLLRGLVRIAQPPPKVQLPEQPPYR